VIFNELQARSLILNSSYEPIKIVNWQKAILLWLQNKVEVLEFHAIQVRSAHAAYDLPSVLRLQRYVKAHHQRRVRFSRENVYLRDRFLCQYCGHQFPPKKLTLDHVLPISRGGGHDWFNVVTSCGPCNNKKGGRTPQEARMPLLNIPKVPKSLPRQQMAKSIELFPESWRPYFPTRTRIVS